MRRRAKQQLHNLLGLVNGGAGGLGLLGFIGILWSASGVMAAVRTALNIASVAVESLRIANFTPEQVVELYAQHTAETGQPFTPEATDRAFEYSQGQPWLVNALAREVTQAMRVSPPMPITAKHIDEAKERIILARPTHLDSLAEISSASTAAGRTVTVLRA